MAMQREPDGHRSTDINDSLRNKSLSSIPGARAGEIISPNKGKPGGPSVSLGRRKGDLEETLKLMRKADQTNNTSPDKPATVEAKPAE